MRNRKLPFHKLALFLLLHSGRSLQREIDLFYEGLGYSSSKLALTKGAISRARSALCPQVFKALNQESIRAFYQQGKVKRWKGHIVKAIDGSTTILPESHPSIKQAFPAHGFGPKAACARHMAYLSQLYDVFNGVVCDAQMAPYATDEMTLAKAHLKHCSSGEVLLLDRFYPSYGLFVELLQRKLHFCVRMKNGWWKQVRELVDSHDNDRIVVFELPKAHHHYAQSIRLRLIKMKDKNGKIRVFCTSLLDEKQYSRLSISNLYKKRWRIEECYKTLKQRLQLDQFTGITSWAVRQDYYAKILLISLCRIMAFDIKPTRKAGQKTNSKKAKPLKINYTYALSRVKQVIIQMLQNADLVPLVRECQKRIALIFEPSKEGNHNPRIFKRKVCRTNYKPL